MTAHAVERGSRDDAGARRGVVPWRATSPWAARRKVAQRTTKPSNSMVSAHFGILNTAVATSSTKESMFKKVVEKSREEF